MGENGEPDALDGAAVGEDDRVYKRPVTIFRWQVGGETTVGVMNVRVGSKADLVPAFGVVGARAYLGGDTVEAKSSAWLHRYQILGAAPVTLPSSKRSNPLWRD